MAFIKHLGWAVFYACLVYLIFLPVGVFLSPGSPKEMNVAAGKVFLTAFEAAEGLASYTRQTNVRAERNYLNLTGQEELPVYYFELGERVSFDGKVIGVYYRLMKLTDFVGWQSKEVGQIYAWRRPVKTECLPEDISFCNKNPLTFVDWLANWVSSK